MKIGVLDSGIGGLTVLKRLINEYPEHEYIYYGDTLHMPYGSKEKEEVIKYGNNIIKFLEQKGAELIVIACGTLSSNKEYLKSNVELIDILSPLNNKLDIYKSVSIIATPLSVKTNAYSKYIHTNIHLISAPLLVPIIESNDYSNLDNVLDSYLKNINSEVLLLGCTHYPIIKNFIEKHYKGIILCLDEFVLGKIPRDKNSSFMLTLYFSKVDDNLINNVNRLLDGNYNLKEALC